MGYAIDGVQVEASAADLNQLVAGANPSGAEDYHVDLNVSTSGDGLAWDTPMATIAEAITASNISIGLTANRWWARRNRIFVQGDGITESLTVLPEKTDIIGVGSDLLPFPRVLGNHTIAALAVGVRFINMGFKTTGTGDLFVIPTACHGLQFLGCFFEPGTTSTKALEITSSAHVKIINCDFAIDSGNMSNIFAMCISMEGTTGHNFLIKGNRMTGTAGIQVATAYNGHGSVIDGNIMRVTNLAVDDDSNKVQVTNNRWMTDINTSTSTDGYDFNIQLAAGNIQMGATGLCDTVPFTKIAE
ncbi:hypothetical protein LCGC14_2006480 [marine sediment metagenome]|uniref:Right handed beta helix domain-containing protein n=1 Tax=marine sediment metagenome TaxID=412755 RepID=A0A0F9F1N8_9ZZZZ